MIGWIKGLFEDYKPGRIYWVHTKDIKVNPQWRKTKIGKKKWRRKIKYWYRTGELESQIILDKDFNLIDGYSSVRIAEVKRIDKVPVWFVGR